MAELYKTFGDETRVRILWSLRGGGCCVKDLVESLGMSQPAVSHQLAKLKTARLVSARRQGRETVYSLADNHVELLLDMGVAHLMEER